MRLSRTSILGLLCPLFLAACAGTENSAMSVLVQNDNYTVQLIAPLTPTKSIEQQIVFLITRDGEPQDVVEEMHMLHAVVASKDSTDIAHTNVLERIDAGTYAFAHTFTQAGPYRVWVEINGLTSQHHGEQANVIVYQDLSVADSTTPQPAMNSSVRQNPRGMHMVLSSDTFASGEPSTLRLQIENDTGTPFALPEHGNIMFAVAGDEFAFFRHGHFDARSDDEKSVSLSLTFPKPGRYGLWLETYVLQNDEYRHIRMPFMLTVL